MKKTLVFILCMLLLMGCTSPKVTNENNENQISTLDTISYIDKTDLTQRVVGDIKDDYPVYEYELSQLLKSASIQVWEKENQWENKITSYEDDIYSKGQIAIVLKDEAYNIHLIHSDTENSLVNYNVSQHYSKSLNNHKIMSANVLDNKKIEAGEEIVLFTVLGYKDDKPTQSQEYSDFKDIDCDYGVVITITFYDTEQAQRVNDGQ